MNARLSRRTAVGLISIMAASPWLPSSVRAQDVVLAIRGYDPVAYFTDGHPVQGLPDFEYVWDDHVSPLRERGASQYVQSGPGPLCATVRKFLRDGVVQRTSRRCQPGELVDQRRQALRFRQPGAGRSGTFPKRSHRQHQEGEREPVNSAEAVVVTGQSAGLPRPGRDRLCACHRAGGQDRPI